LGILAYSSPHILIHFAFSVWEKVFFGFVKYFSESGSRGCVNTGVTLKISDLQKITGKLEEARSLIASVMDESGFKKCRTCKEFLPGENFYANCGDCKPCRTKRSSNRYHSNKSKETPCSK
jgi:hypothetical protein